MVKSGNAYVCYVVLETGKPDLKGKKEYLINIGFNAHVIVNKII